MRRWDQGYEGKGDDGEIERWREEVLLEIRGWEGV